MWLRRNFFFFFFFLPFLALILSSPIDGVASNIFSFFLLYMETLDHPNFSVWLHFFLTYHLIPRGRNHLNIAKVAFADGGKRTRAACTASECAIHFIIASRQHTWRSHLPHAVLGSKLAAGKSTRKSFMIGMSLKQVPRGVAQGGFCGHLLVFNRGCHLSERTCDFMRPNPSRILRYWRTLCRRPWPRSGGWWGSGGSPRPCRDPSEKDQTIKSPKFQRAKQLSSRKELRKIFTPLGSANLSN